MDQSKSLLERLVDLDRPAGVRISPSARQVVYQTSPLGRASDDAKAIIWLADVDVEHSARQLTSGLHYDRSPRWTPDGKSVVFISDRAKPGKSCALYCLNLASGGGGEAFPLTDIGNEQSIDDFWVEPNSGKSIAFISVDEDSPEQKRKEEHRDDAQVDGKDEKLTRLRLLHVATKVVRPIYAVERDVICAAWSDDSSALTCLNRATPDVDDEEFRFSTISVSSGRIDDICDFQGSLSSDICYNPFDPEEVHFVAAASPLEKPNFGSRPYSVNLKARNWREIKGPERAFSQSECYQSVSRSASTLVYKSQTGTADRACIFMSSGTGKFIQEHFYSTEVRRSMFNFGECEFAVDRQGATTRLVGVFVRTSTEHPDEVVSVSRAIAADQDAADREQWTETRLSDHGATISERPCGARPLRVICHASPQRDWLENLLFVPEHAQDKPKKLPCVVLIHGGPYSRCRISFDPFGLCWIPLLAEQGYAILCPNYAGSAGQGPGWANLALGQVGTVDYDDIIAAIWAAISEGYIDADRVVVGGWSQGGFLSYLAATRNGLPYSPDVQGGSDERRLPPFALKGAICGAGVSDWDMMVSTSVQSAFQALLCGGRPWTSEKSDTSTRRGSPLWEMARARKEDIPPILALHGKEDTQVPWSQALAYSRACKAKGVPCEFVTYPREGHDFVERAHFIDMAQRVLRFVDSLIG